MEIRNSMARTLFEEKSGNFQFDHYELFGRLETATAELFCRESPAFAPRQSRTGFRLLAQKMNYKERRAGKLILIVFEISWRKNRNKIYTDLV